MSDRCKPMNRRSFISKSALALFGFTILPGAGRVWQAVRAPVFTSRLYRREAWRGSVCGVMEIFVPLGSYLPFLVTDPHWRFIGHSSRAISPHCYGLSQFTYEAASPR